MKTQLRFNRTLSRVHIDIPAGHLARNRSYKMLWIKHSNMSDKSWEKLSTNHQHTGTGIMLQQKKDQKPLSWFCKAGGDWRPTTEVVSPLSSHLSRVQGERLAHNPKEFNGFFPKW